MSLIGWDNCFPSVIGACERKDLLPTLQNILDNVDNNEWNGGHLRNYTTLNTKENKDLKKELLKEVSHFLKSVMHIDCKIQLTTSWFTRNQKGQCSDFHHHVNSWYSACYYLTDGAEIEFSTKPQAIYVPPTKWTLENSVDVTYTPNVGDMLIFPSHLTHRGIPYAQEGDRYSFAMNFMPKGKVGAWDSTYKYE